MKSLTTSEGSVSPIEGARPDLSEIRAAYEAADLLCREVQAFVDEAGIPAINEMRYAGHHLMSALGNDGSLENPDNLTKAHNHVQRACYEACEAGILFALDRIRIFKDQYQTIVVTDVLSGYPEILKTSQDALKRVSVARAAGRNRNSDHSELIDLFRKLAGHCRDLDLARPELNKVVAKERRDTRRFIIATTLSILAIVAVGVFAFWHG